MMILLVWYCTSPLHQGTELYLVTKSVNRVSHFFLLGHVKHLRKRAVLRATEGYSGLSEA